ncbi:hypothetical protein BAC2_01114 [uncultured bacterium]|nr:hypothetical protein BAC2_01114 [uncultured bacterium]
MNGAELFFDTNVLLYLLSADVAKADRAESLIAGGGVISVQVLNEFASVAVRKHALSYAEIRDALEPIRTVCKLVPLTAETHELGLRLAERYGFSVYDAMIVAAALLAGCGTLYSEDMRIPAQDRREIPPHRPDLGRGGG